MNWISRLERKYGRFCIPNLISISSRLRLRPR